MTKLKIKRDVVRGWGPDDDPIIELTSSAGRKHAMRKDSITRWVRCMEGHEYAGMTRVFTNYDNLAVQEDYDDITEALTRFERRRFIDGGDA